MDLYHAREHLHDLARILEFMLGDREDNGSPPAWRTWTRQHRGHRAAARKYPLDGVKNEIDTDLGYFENNTPRMRYHWFRPRGLFVGSGLVEAGCKIRHRPAAQAGRHALDRRRRRHHHRPALPAGQPTWEDQSVSASHTGRARLTRRSQARATPPAGYRL